VVDKFIIQLEGQLADRGVMIELTDAARSWLGRKGYDAKMGARPLARTIQEFVKKPLAEELLFGRLSKGGLVRIDVQDGKVVFDYPGGKPLDTPIIDSDPDSDAEPETPEPELVI
jgi:ATP-dependent Clp protease ATP-binding subunit ClpA